MTVHDVPSRGGRTTRRAAVAAARALSELAELDDFDTKSISSTRSNKRTKPATNLGPRKRPTPSYSSDFAESEYDAEEDLDNVDHDHEDDHDNNHEDEDEDDNQEGDDIAEPAQQFAVPEGNSNDAWLISEAGRKHPHKPLTAEQRSAREKAIGRGLINWSRPMMSEKLLLIICFELARHQIEVPWEAIAHRFHPGSTGSAIQQHLVRLRMDVASKGHLVPPQIPKSGVIGTCVDPTIRGYIRQDDEDTGEPTLLPARYTEVWEDLKHNRPDSIETLAKLNAAGLETRQKTKSTKSKGKARKMLIPHTRKTAGNTRTRRATGHKTIPGHSNAKDSIVTNTCAVTTPNSMPDSSSPGTESSGINMNNVDIDSSADLNIFMRNPGLLNDDELQAFLASRALRSAAAPATPKISFNQYMGAPANSPIHNFSQTLNGLGAGAPALQYGAFEHNFAIFGDETRTEAQE